MKKQNVFRPAYIMKKENARMKKENARSYTHICIYGSAIGACPIECSIDR